MSQLILTSSRKQYINDAELIGIEGEKVSDFDENKYLYFELKKQGKLEVKAESGLMKELEVSLKQLSLVQDQKLASIWPDAYAVESVSQQIFERIHLTRESGKKHIQRRAFIDLLKYLKGEGLSANFETSLTPHIMKSKLCKTGVGALDNDLRKYFFKAHELNLMIENSSEACEDVRNADILRIKSLMRSLMTKLMELNERVS